MILGVWCSSSIRRIRTNNFLCYSLPYCYMFLRVSYNFGMEILDK
jgi:hypothetical protein